jgi:hypothetical protein
MLRFALAFVRVSAGKSRHAHGSSERRFQSIHSQIEGTAASTLVDRTAGGIEMMGRVLRCMSPVLCWFLDAGKKEAPQAQLTGVQKAPRHEVAGS